MENELTLQLQMPYSKVSNMDENIESGGAVKMPFLNNAESTQTVASEKSDLSLEQRQQIAQKSWELVLANIGEEKFNQEQIDEIRQKIQAGEGPPIRGGANGGQQENSSEVEGDGIYSSINRVNFVGTPLQPLVDELYRAGMEKREVNQQMINSIFQRASALHQNGEVDDPLFNNFINELQGLVRTDQARRQGGSSRERLENTPSSIQEMCRWIAEKEGEQWGPTGINPLLEKTVNEEGKEIFLFRPENFTKWVRERMLFFHNFSPDDPNVNLLGQIGVETEFRTIGLGTMITNKNRYFRDENSGEIYDDFIEDLVNEVFLFNQSRNYDAGYRFEMWNESKLPGFLAGIHQKSVFTTSRQLRTIMTLAADFGKKDKDGNLIKDTKVGDSIRKLYEAYYYISDFEKLKEVLGGDSQFFTRKGFENAYRLTNNLAPNAQIPKEYADLFDGYVDSQGRKVSGLFDEKGNAKPKEFIDFVNLFNVQGKNQSTNTLVREALRLAVSDIYKLENGLNEQGEARKIIRKNLEYAEAFAFSMVRWTGAGARNDTGAIGYDAITKLQRFQDYRVRQARAERGGAFGNEYDLPVVKSLAVDFFNGIFVEKGVGESHDLTPFEIFQRIDAIDRRSDISQAEKAGLKDAEFDKLKFKQYTQLGYANDHLARGAQVFEWITSASELNLDQIVKHEPFRGLVFDRAKFEEQVKDKFMKPIRYVFSTYANIDYSKETRIIDKAATSREGRPVYKNVTFAEAMFGPDVLEDFYKKDENGNRVIDKDKLKKDRGLLYKRVVRALLAAQLKSHRERFSGYTKMDYAQVEKFYEALESIREIEIDDDGENAELLAKQGFFTKEDISWMRKKSHTGKKRMIFEDVGPDVVMGAMGGFLKGTKDFFSDAFR